jgi:predicted transcriptional regulator YdeE
MSDTDNFLAKWRDGADGLYLAGWEVEPDANLPEGWDIWEIPELTYVVVTCTFPDYEDAFKFVVNDFLPKNGYKQTGAQHEFYPEEFKDIEKDFIDLYFIVSKA